MSAPPLGVEADAGLARLTTIGTGGPARFLARPQSAAELTRVLAWAGDEGMDVAVIGLGSNLLVADEGYDGVALRLEGELAAIEIDGTNVRCGGGASLAAIVRRAT
jgi:UDP-N-acetylmuramate dehydrogenase